MDTMGRLYTMTDLAANAPIISTTTYGPANQMLTMNGASNTLYESRTYNSMLQLTQLSAQVVNSAESTWVSVNYNYPSSNNNGKIASQTDNISGEQVLYTYDALNRLATAAATSNAWAQSYSYDGFGNLLVQNQYGSAPYYSASPNPTTNQLGSVDANGNTTSYINSSNVSIALTYDVKNRLNTVGGYQGPQYSYAPGNKRVWRGLWTSGTLTTDEVTFWSVSGQKLATYQLSVNGGVINDSSSAPVLVATQTGTNYYFGRKLIKNSTWYGYVAADRLGSIGKFYPYGQEKPSATTNGTEKFTGYFRDAETGLDYADQRFHNPGTGRFLTPDLFQNSAGPTDPGSWNRYAYTRGDPVNRVDPSGLYDLVVDGSQQDDNDGSQNIGENWGCPPQPSNGLTPIYGLCYAPAVEVPEGPIEAPSIPTTIALVAGTTPCYSQLPAQIWGGPLIPAVLDDSLDVLNQSGQVIGSAQINEVLTPMNQAASRAGCPTGTTPSGNQCIGEPVIGDFNDQHATLNGATQIWYQTFNVVYNGVTYNSLAVSVFNTSPSSTIVIDETPYSVWLNGNNSYQNGKPIKCGQ
jgi:RHS repeat-associated protein